MYDHEQFLVFLVSSFESEAELDGALARIGYSAVEAGIYAGALKRKENFRQLLRLAEGEGWTQLLMFAAFSARPAYEDRREAGKRLSKHEMAGLDLFDRLRELDVQKVVAAFETLDVKDLILFRPKDTKVTSAFVALAVVLAQEARDKSQVLHAFLQALISQGLDDGQRKELDRWWQQAAAPLGLKGSLVAGPTHRAERYSVMIELRDASKSTPAQPAWLRIAWLYRHSDGHPDRLDDDLPPDEVETLATLPQYLSKLRDRLEKRRVEPLDAVLFEFFLPRSSLFHALDSVKIPFDVGLEPMLGILNPVIIRCQDRKPETRSTVRTRWTQLRDAASLNQLSLTAKGPGGNATSLFRDFVKAPNLQCLIVLAPLAGFEDIGKLPCLIAAIAAGLPLIVWARHPDAVAQLETTAAAWAQDPNAAAQLKNAIAAWLAKPPRAFPDELREIRRGCPDDDPNHYGNNLTLFFENGDYWMPANPEATETRK